MNTDLDIGKYLARHNVVFGGRIESRDDCALVGTGVLGACVWQEGGALVLQVTNADASPQAQMSSGTVRIDAELNGGSRTVLDLYKGRLRIDYECGVTFCVYGAGEAMEIEVTDCRKGIVTSVGLSGWDTSCLFQNDFRWKRCVKNPQDWVRFRDESEGEIPMIGRSSTSGAGQQGVDEYEDVADETVFGYTLGIALDGVRVERDGWQVSFCGAQRYRVKIANPSAFSGKDTRTVCLRMLEEDFTDLKQRSEKFWADFWNASYIVNHSEGSDYIENMYYLSKYILACGMFGKNPLHFITGVFRSHGDDGITWAVAYWWYNQRCVYGWLNACGNGGLWKAQFDLYLKNSAKIEQDTRKKYPTDEGMVVPETMCWDGRRSFCENSLGAVVAEFINCTGEEIALKMFEYFEYCGDEKYLREQVIPFAHKVLQFAISHELTRREDGVYEIKPGVSNARESYVKIGNPVTSLGALRALLPKMIAWMESEGQDAAEYKEILQNLVPFSMGGYPKRFLAGDGGLNYPRSNWDDPCLELVYPYNLLGNGKEFYNEIVNNYIYRIGRDELLACITWDNSSIWAARLGLADDARECLKWQIAKSQVFRNGIGTDGNCKYEFSGNLITALNETMLQSYDGVIRVFPAVCLGERGSVAKFRLHASGGFVVESEFDFQAFQAKFVKIVSEHGKECRIFNPYGAGNTVLIEAGEKVFESRDEVIRFKTECGGVYVLRAKDLKFTESETEYTENETEKVFCACGFRRSLGQ